jgi:hypothetical protein
MRKTGSALRVRYLERSAVLLAVQPALFCPNAIARGGSVDAVRGAPDAAESVPPTKDKPLSRLESGTDGRLSAKRAQGA